MRVMIYQGSCETLNDIKLIPGEEYAIKELGYSDSLKLGKGILSRLLGIYHNLHNTYNVMIYGDEGASLCAYSSKDVFDKYWKEK